MGATETAALVPPLLMGTKTAISAKMAGPTSTVSMAGASTAPGPMGLPQAQSYIATLQ